MMEITIKITDDKAVEDIRGAKSTPAALERVAQIAAERFSPPERKYIHCRTPHCTEALATIEGLVQPDGSTATVVSPWCKVHTPLYCSGCHKSLPFPDSSIEECCTCEDTNEVQYKIDESWQVITTRKVETDVEMEDLDIPDLRGEST